MKFGLATAPVPTLATHAPTVVLLQVGQRDKRQSHRRETPEGTLRSSLRVIIAGV